MRGSVRCISLLLAAALILGTALSLTACHGSVERPVFEVPTSFDESENIEIVFWAKNDTNKAQTAVYDSAVSGFEALYPNVKVTIRPYTNYGDIYNDVITNIATDTTPNVCITYPDHVATYLTGENVVVPLDSLMADKKWGLGGEELRFDGPDNGEIVEKFLRECVIDGTVYALPFMRSTEACYINRDYVEALGYEVPDVLTWDFIWEVSEAATEKDASGKYKLNGQKTLIPFIYKSTDNMMIQMLEQLGAGYSTGNGDILIFNEGTESVLMAVAEHSETRAFNTFASIGYPANYLNKGQCVFAIDSTAGATWMGPEAPLSDIHSSTVAEFETVVRPIPQFDTKNPRMISQGPSVCIFNKENPNEVLASWLFVQYLLTNEIQLAYSATEGYAPVTTKAQTSAEYLDYLSRSGEDNDMYYSIKLDATKILLENTENTFVTPVFNGSASLRSVAGELIETVAKDVRRGEVEEVDSEYLSEVFGELSALYKLDTINRDPGTMVSFGRLPAGSVALIAAAGSVWIILGAYHGTCALIKKKKERKSQ
ncbi:MAG: extracellular solute-binding protein [Clostridia bacterium]|nr:extracellular solute-binding protein [Clostridia bacterium]